MALARWQATIVDSAGNIQAGASVTVRREVIGSPLANLFEDRDGLMATGNPITADIDGYAFFHVAGGAYRITASLGGFSRTWRYVALGTAAEHDSEDFTDFIQAGSGAVIRPQNSKLQEFVSVKDFGATGNGVTDDKAAFELAAQASGTVYVPAGSYAISAGLTNSAMWVLDDDAVIVGLSDVGDPSFPVPDTSRLTGRVFHTYNRASGLGIRMGDSDPWLERNIRTFTEGIADLAVISPYGQIAAVFASRTSDDVTSNFACIGVEAFGINDNTAAYDTAWAAYLEARRTSNSVTGPTYGMEIDTVNQGSVVDIHPSTDISTTAHQVPLWIASGAEVVGAADSTAAMVVLNNGAAFRRGIIFLEDALDATFNEAIAMPAGVFLSWYAGGSLFGHLTHFLRDWRHHDNSAGHQDFYQRARASAAATQTSDSIQRSQFEGWDGSADYMLAYTQAIQRSNFSGSNARGSYDIGARNTDGTESQVSLNGLANKSFAPFPDNSISLGDSSFRWTNVYTTGAIVQNGVPHFTPIRKTTDEQKTSNTSLAADGVLQFAMAANTKYAIRAKIFYDTPTAADLKWRHAGPTSPNLVRIKRSSVAPGATAEGGIAVDTAFSGADIVITETSGNSGYIEFEGIVHTGANAGTFSFQWAQNTSNGSPTTVWTGSYLEYAIT